MSPKTLATVFESCLDPQGIDQDVPRGISAPVDEATLEAKHLREKSPAELPEKLSKKVLLVEDNLVNLKVLCPEHLDEIFYILIIKRLSKLV